MAQVEAISPEQGSKATGANDSAILAVRGPRLVDSAAEPPLEPQFDGPIQWEEFATFSGPLEGYIVAGRLNSEGVPTIVEVDPLALTFSRPSVIWVPRHLIHRARWVLAWSPISEAELTFLATGELSSTEDEKE